ncbi:hypothetical protein OBBRIDRAFT_787699 [Obba rivulosa]|uniref:Chromatin target of PRMT1 protein C-terminal domain-containing protein n=1 Tax=Obba rivulosa TaxID=1052685 RepID=A0A8E2DUE7_9APHY|nr:hypothetical protein OBBRIDRAFT_787699 [Obba rivulosa]
MDVTPAVLETLEEQSISYDVELSYDDPVPATTEPSTEPPRPELANRIGNTKVYLLSETTGARAGKRKHAPEEDAREEMDEDTEMDEGYRTNAILLRGTPIAHLPTSNIFAYATHFDAHPMALEWIDDTTCILVFSSKTSARAAFWHLAKSAAEEPSAEDGSITAKPIPIAIWPPEDRINKSLGKGEGLKGPIRMRWATHEDVKQKGARNMSEFYKKYGSKAGKESTTGGLGPEDARSQKKSRRDVDDVPRKEQLDDELDAFLAEDAPPPSPPSKMRSDYISSGGKTLSERMSSIRAHPSTLSSRNIAELPRRARSPRVGGPREGGGRSLTDRLGEQREPRRTARPKKTQEDLDAELDAFLNERD